MLDVGHANMDNARAKIGQLIQKFEREKAVGAVYQYNESETKAGFIEPLLQAIEGLIAAGVTLQPEPAWHGVYSPGPVNLFPCREALADALASLRNILRRIEPSQHPFQVILMKVQELDRDATLRMLFESILGALRTADVDVH